MNSDTQTRLFTYMERLWIAAIIISILCVAYFLIVRDNDSALFFIGFFVISAVQYLMRKRQKRRHIEYLKMKAGEKPGDKTPPAKS